MSEENRLRMKQLLERSRTEDFKEVYKKRKAIVEPIFGNIKNKGMKILVTEKKKFQPGGRWHVLLIILKRL